MAYCENIGQSQLLSESLSLRELLPTTCGAGGLQILWSTIMANLPLVLHGFGLPKATISIILILQPLAGCLIGPMVGLYSDRLRTAWGRRRPMIVAGAVATSTCLLSLAWLENGVRWLTCKRHFCNEYEPSVRNLVQMLAILCTLWLSISVQPLQSGIRSLMVDRAPACQQSRITAWASRLSGFGGILGFFASSAPLPRYLPFCENITQFQALAILNCFMLGSISCIICVSVDEPDSRDAVFEVSEAENELVALLLHLRTTLRKLPHRILDVCKVQFCAWFAWFSVLYYTTNYIAELAPRNIFPHQNPTDHGAQSGSFASLCFAVVALVTSLALPELTQKLSTTSPSFGNFNSPAEEDRSTGSIQSLAYVSMASQIWLGLSLLGAPLVGSQLAGTIHIALLGISWAVTQWIPFAIIGVELQQMSSDGEQEEKHGSVAGPRNVGTVLGIYNIAISLPQIGAALIDGIIYFLADAAKSRVPTAWVFALGSLPAFIGSLLAKGLRD